MLFLCLIKNHAMETWGNGGIAPQLLTSALDGGGMAGFIPRGNSPGTHWIGGWVGHRAGLDTVERRKILHSRELNP
jgi:hypothetical protein